MKFIYIDDADGQEDIVNLDYVTHIYTDNDCMADVNEIGTEHLKLFYIEFTLYGNGGFRLKFESKEERDKVFKEIKIKLTESEEK